ncbi:unnamed protein product [Camellia sinensis]
MIHRLIIAVEHPQKPRVVTPFPAPKIMDLPQLSKLSEVMQTVHRFFYLANEDGNALSLSRETLNIRENSLLAFGSQTDVGSLNLNLESMDDLEVHYSGFRTSHIHNLSDLVQQNLGAQVGSQGGNRLHVSTDYDCHSQGRISFRTDVAFISGTGVKDSRLKERLSSLTDLRVKLLTLLKEVSGVVQSFSREGVEIRWVRCDQDFKSIGNVMMSMSLTRTQHNALDSESISTGKAAVASLLGGIGYFYGQSKISVPSNSN